MAFMGHSEDCSQGLYPLPQFMLKKSIRFPELLGALFHTSG